MWYTRTMKTTTKKTKKLLTIVLTGGALLLTLTGCVGNKDILGTEYTFAKAQIRLPDGTIKNCDVDTWSRMEHNDNIRVTCKNNAGTYYTGSQNIVLYNN